MGITLHINNSQSLNIISTYCSRGNCSTQELADIIFRNNKEFLILGDFNAHNSMWENPCPNRNRAGNAIHQLLTLDQDVTLLIPINLGTRINPTSRKLSTIDLTMATLLSITQNASIWCGPQWQSGHRPKFMELNLEIPRAKNSEHWCFHEKKLP